MKRKLFLLLAVAFTFSMSFGQTADKKWGIGPDIGVMEYSGDLGTFFYNFNTGYAIGGGLYRYLTPSFDVGLNVFYDHVDKNDQNNLFPGFGLNFSAQMYAVKGEVKYKFNNGYILAEDAKLRPFVKGGLGFLYSNTSGTGASGPIVDRTQTNPNISVGPGLSIPIGELLSLELSTILNFPFNADYIDLISKNSTPLTLNNNMGDFFLQNSIGLRVNLGAKAKDSDGDGVIDKKDQCPDTPPGVAVDENGCPLDSDGDGVPDYKDECPEVAGLELYNGCPDTDGDGIPDKDDDCPEVAGLKVLNGCPDSDGDGVADKDDRCPDTPKGWEVDRFGCPVDRDRDGIPDSEDECPDEPGVAELKGCPWDAPTLMAKYGLNSKLILFDFDKSNLRQSAVNTLNQINQVLQNHKDFGVNLVGHTDWTGSEKYNLGLSDHRAESAKNFLVEKGIAAMRIKTSYQGEVKPTATNESTEGRQLNRRVDYNFFKIK